MKNKQKNVPQKHYSHLTLQDRIRIEHCLNEGVSLRQIALQLDKSPSTISREIKQRRCLKGRRSDKVLPKCALYDQCEEHSLCPDTRCYAYRCKSCSRCKEVCSLYTPGRCHKLEVAPFVCNSCNKIKTCTYERLIYVAKYADDTYQEILSASREGVNQTPEHMQEMDRIVTPLIKQGQSLAHIYATHAAELDCSRTTLYDYIDKCYFSVRNIDLPRKVKYRTRKSTQSREVSDGSFRAGRTYEDFCAYTAANPFTPVVEMDTVVGKRDSGKVLLTLLFRSCSLMLIILLPNKSQGAVIYALNILCERIGIEKFRKLCPVLLTDNGSEFQNPEALECDAYGEIKTKVFYCHPNCSWEKGMIEKNHEFIRYIIPKGNSFDNYTQEDITLMTNHINSVARDSLNGFSPYKLSLYHLDNALHREMNLVEIDPDDVIMNPSLLRKR